jgi:uncharacterized protein (TIGR02594 family)
MTVLDIQRALKARGIDPGPLDGIWGRKTIEAVKAFQKGSGLAADGIVGPKTWDALNASVSFAAPVLTGPALPVWYIEAQRHKGLKEVAGKQHSSVIQKWLKFLKAGWSDDETAWCGTYVGWCIGSTLPDEPLPTNPFGARRWEKFGEPLKVPAIGAVAVFWRGSKTGWQGHVGFYAGEDQSCIHVLGGNQSNAVTVTRISKSRLLGYRWPSTVPLPTTGRVSASATGKVSENEA